MPRQSANKSLMVRELLDARGPQTPNKDIVATLAHKKIKVTSALVSNIKAAQREAALRRDTRTQDTSNDMVSLELLRRGKILMDLATTVDEAKRVLDVLEELRRADFLE